jgi:phospholipid/cholesterol/gamma-HCH transport system substrate-binding protein
MSVASQNLAQLSDKLNREFDQIQLRQATRNLNQIFEKINNGTGTIGALVNDPGLYDELRALTGGANRNRIMRNLIRQTIKENKNKENETK